PYGMLLNNRHGSVDSDAYRYGFQGQERDDEVKGEGNSYNYTYRMHDPRLGRFFAVDPLAPKYPHYTPYQFSGNKVIAFVELEGLEEAPTPDKKSTYENNKRFNDSDRRNILDYGDFEEVDLDYAERKLNGFVDEARNYGYNFSADNLEHFLGNTGEDRNVSKDVILGDVNLRNLIRFNLQRIWLGDMSDDVDGLEVGESKVFDKYYVDSTNASLFSDNYYASGGSNIKTTTKLTITRTGEMSWNVKGSVHNIWSDTYDWHGGLGVYIPGEGMVGDELGEALSYFGRAKGFKLKSSWETKVNFNVYGVWGVVTWGGLNSLEDSVKE
ncbi:RHS repeat-associated protein, partial [Nonlabens xylanidelens]